MKKIDLHIHTVPTFSDAHFNFCIEAFKQYVADVELDAVAVTNHDTFNKEQYREIKDTLDITVFPGIEVRVEGGHVLVISDGSDLDGFVAKCNIVSSKISSVKDSISIEELKEFFVNLDEFLVIPHFDKNPALTGDSLEKLAPHFVAGEVSSHKKFLRNIKDVSCPTPVLFSDVRIQEGLGSRPPRYTYIDCGELTLTSIKECLKDKTKVALTIEEGNKLFPVFSEGQMLSTGLNVLLGARSSGKTHTLKRIHSEQENVKHIEQFQLVQKDEKKEKALFKEGLEKSKSAIVDSYLNHFKGVLDEMMNIDLSANDRAIQDYVDSLLKTAANEDRRDAFSRAALFNETPYSPTNSEQLERLIRSVENIIENVAYRNIIKEHIDRDSMKTLIRELIERFRSDALETKKKTWVNELVKDVQSVLQRSTADEAIKDVNLNDICMDEKRVERFSDLVIQLKRDKIILSDKLSGFVIQATKKPFVNATDLKSAIHSNSSLSNAYSLYSNSYDFLRALVLQEDISNADIYKLFVKIEYRVINEDGRDASGGEKSEFNLLQGIEDAQNYDILLIDEPESSFDNLFLKSGVNDIIKQISTTMPVVVVTHNSTVGASIDADYLLYAEKEKTEEEINYRLYSGYPADKELRSVDGKTIPTHNILMDSLEAGSEAYDNRRQVYEAVND